MNTQRLVFAAVIIFVVAWSTLAALAGWRSRSHDAGLSTPAATSADGRTSLDDVAKHHRLDDCWIVVRGKVYDVTRYIHSHPAPPRTIIDYCGTESTWAFETKERGRPHSQRAWKLLETYYVGEVSE